MASYVTLKSEKHGLVHASLYATMEQPGRKQKQVFTIHMSCGRTAAHSDYVSLGERSKRRFFTCIGCARAELPKDD